jgi:hypothetical protein
MNKLLLFLGLFTSGIAGFAQSSLESIIRNSKSDSLEKKMDKWEKKSDHETEMIMKPMFSFIPGDSESYSGSIFGLSLGFNLNALTLSDQTTIKAGLAYTMQGGAYQSYQYEPGGNMGSYKAKVRLSYLQLPITVQHHVKERWYAEAGIQTGLLLSARDHHSSGTDKIKDIYKPLDFGLIMGAGYKSPQKWGVGIQFNPGISNINRKTGPYKNAKDRNAALTLKLSYQL